ncbi:MAG: hypothetical protein IKD31_07255 [Clostridia bacterium]|nr:hypothetical protein [Clostridia bacterium]
MPFKKNESIIEPSPDFKINTLNDDVFKADYYDEFVSQIVSNQEYKRLEQISKAMGLHITFYFCRTEDWRSIQYDVGFEVCDDKGKCISVSESSDYFDYLYNLIAESPAVIFRKFSKKLEILTIDQRELCEDCKLFADYLKGEPFA